MLPLGTSQHSLFSPGKCSLASLSPGPFFPDGIAVAQSKRVDFFLKVKHASTGRSPERTWTFPSKVESIVFSPDGRKLAVGMFEQESIVIASLECGKALELA